MKVFDSLYLHQWRDLADKEGSVHFICTWYDLKPWTPPETGSADGDLHNPAAILSVFVESAKNLEIIEETEPSTVVTLTVGAQEQCTKSVLSTPNPSYDENFHFRLNRFNLLESLTLKVAVCDVDSDDILGIVCKPLPSIINSPGMSVHRPHALIGGAGVSELNLRASIKYLVEPDALNEPRAGDRTDSTGSSEDLEGIEMREPDPLPTPPSPEESGTSLRKRLVEGRTEVDLREECNNPETSTRTNMGEVELTFAYDKSKQVLSITVLRCSLIRLLWLSDIKLLLECDSFWVCPGRELLTSDSSAEPPSAYVKLYLLPEKSRKYKSEVFKDSFYPEFNEKFECPVAQEELSSHSLEVTVKHYESLFSRKEIGQVEIPLTNMAANNSLTKCRTSTYERNAFWD
ncbi:extended synaptotagmin-1-like [Watersipora subatra]|uniref:extended synaptotagmin-1-like n=1 Tax=Watersipora subatra TaxID=2589382 RepID=UPI00355BDC73